MFSNHGSMVVNVFNKHPGYIKQNIINVPIWQNCVTIVNKSLFIDVWYQSGIKLVGDFLSKNGAFLTYDNFIYIRLTCLMYMSCNLTVL